jgi:hypothetical protein
MEPRTITQAEAADLLASSYETGRYEPLGLFLVDVDPRAGRKPDICTKQGNAFDGEPCDPVDGDFIFIPRRDTW